MPYIALTSFCLVVVWLLRRDGLLRQGVSAFTWIPTMWAAILLSRPLSAWLGVGGGVGGVQSQEGSPLDRAFYQVAIAAAVLVLVRRRVPWARMLLANWHWTLLYAYMLVTVLWADSPVVSFKRWVKDAGNFAIVLVILTEVRPWVALRAVFVRCAYVLIPLSLLFIRYFPHLGRRYSVYTGVLEPTGVTFQKNSLGALVMVAGLVLVWDLLEDSVASTQPTSRLKRLWGWFVVAIGMYLLYLCDSKTSILCFAISSGIVATIRMPLLRRRIARLGVYAMCLLTCMLALDQAFGLSQQLVMMLGRDMTFTGRTEVWDVLLGLSTDPIIGTGFYSFWSDHRYLSQLPEWVAFSAHNGYLETYLDGGVIALGILALALGVQALRSNRQLQTGDSSAVFGFAVLVTTLVANVSESHFFRMSPLAMLLFAATLWPDKIEIGSMRRRGGGRGSLAAGHNLDLTPAAKASAAGQGPRRDVCRGMATRQPTRNRVLVDHVSVHSRADAGNGTGRR